MAKVLLLDVAVPAEPDVGTMLCEPREMLRATSMILGRETKEVEADETNACVDIVLIGGDAFLECRAALFGKTAIRRGPCGFVRNPLPVRRFRRHVAIIAARVRARRGGRE